MIFHSEIPPTAGLPMAWHDWLPTKDNLAEKIAEMFGLPPLLLECSGTASLIIALKTLKAMPQNAGRNEVIIPAFNCPLVVFAMTACGLSPRLCDTALNHFDFDFDCLKTLISNKTLAILPTHIGGQCADVAACVELAHKNGAFVIEDVAQALGTSAGKIGDIAFFSLAVGKGLTLFEGGLLTAQNSDLRMALKHTHNTIVHKNTFLEIKRLNELLGYSFAYRPSMLRWVYGMPRRKALAKGDFENAVGDVFKSEIPIHQVSQLRAKRGARAAQRLPLFLHQTGQQAEKRIEQLELIKSITVLKGLEGQLNVWPFIMVIMPDKKSRDNALHKLWASPYGVTRLFIHSLAHYDCLAPYLGQQVATPHADNLADRLLTISNSLWLKQVDFDFICKVLQNAADRSCG